VNIALIPARAGSKRLPNKNLINLKNKPLIGYTIEAAIKTELFTEIIVSTDSQEIAEIALKYGAQVPSLRPKDIAGDLSCDIDWVKHAINQMIKTPPELVKNLAILRPTNPLRSSNTIVSGFAALTSAEWADSLRALQRIDQHPGKMWKLDKSGKATPYLDQSNRSVPTHDSPTQSLNELWVQNASLEIVRLAAVLNTGTISGRSVLGFEMPGIEGYDINTIEDLKYLDFLISINPKLLSS